MRMSVSRFDVFVDAGVKCVDEIDGDCLDFSTAVRRHPTQQLLTELQYHAHSHLEKEEESFAWTTRCVAWELIPLWYFEPARVVRPN